MFGYESLGMNNLSIFMAILCMLWTFGIFCGLLVYITHFGILYQENFIGKHTISGQGTFVIWDTKSNLNFLDNSLLICRYVPLHTYLHSLLKET
jgi:hypothetical protein